MLVIVFGFLLLIVADAFHDHYVFRAVFGNVEERVPAIKKYHALDAVTWGCIVGLLAYGIEGLTLSAVWFACALLSLRWLVFDSLYNTLAGTVWNYVGTIAVSDRIMRYFKIHKSGTMFLFVKVVPIYLFIGLWLQFPMLPVCIYILGAIIVYFLFIWAKALITKDFTCTRKSSFYGPHVAVLFVIILIVSILADSVLFEGIKNIPIF